MRRGLRDSGGFGAARARALCAAFVVLCAVLGSTLGASGAGRRQKQAAGSKEVKSARTLYRIVLSLDFARGYQGTESVRWTNRDDRPASVLYFHLYPNMRAEDE